MSKNAAGFIAQAACTQCKIASQVPTLRTFVSIVLDGCHGGFKLCQLGPHGDPFMILAALHDIACTKLSECFLLGGWSQSRKHTCAPFHAQAFSPPSRLGDSQAGISAYNGRIIPGLYQYLSIYQQLSYLSVTKHLNILWMEEILQYPALPVVGRWV